MLALKLAYKNLMGAGLRTWLNVIVLSFSFVVIIFFKGMLDGWDRQAKRDMIAWEMGGGQYWHEAYDPYDPFTLNDSHARLPTELKEQAEEGMVTPILIIQGSAYPDGRMQTTFLKGIDPDQQILSLPTELLKKPADAVPAIIGSSMSRSAKLDSGDYVTVRWRDVNGTFDATELVIAGVFKTNVPSVDAGQIWLPLERLREMTLLEDEATIIVTSPGVQNKTDINGWVFKDQSFLLKDIDKIIKTKSVGSSVFYVILLLLAMLAIFDTQVLSVFRRQREIGTYIAMGMTRRQVVGLFTAEGAMHAILAILVGAIYGIPLFVSQAKGGLQMPMTGEDYGITLADKIYPVYGAGLVLTTILIVTLTTTIVSYLPARKIAKMNPTEAIKGKLQ